MLIKEWLSEFIADHQARHHRADWPCEGSPESRQLWSAWLHGLIELKASRVEAERASRAINGAAVEFIDHHLTVLIGEITRARQAPAKSSLETRAVASLSKDDRLDAAAQALQWADRLTPDQRRQAAGEFLDRLYDLGWEMVWYEDEGQFRTHRTRPDAPQPDIVLSTRLRALKAEVYHLLGHGEPEPEPVEGLNWREMVSRIGTSVSSHERVST